MRDYGKVHTSFWSSDTLACLSDDAKFLALYLLTCPHGNLSGVFRLPIAYVANDTGWESERLRKGFQTLSDAGWLRRDEDRNGWTWVLKWSKWNPPDNPNQRKAADKQLDAVPTSVSFYAELMSPRETLSEPLGNTPVPAPVPAPVLGGAGEIAIPLDDGTEALPSCALLAELGKAYPNVNIPGELAKARAWCFANPNGRKTKRGLSRFLNSWMSTASEKQRGRGDEDHFLGAI
jgi:hypothetical protein